ncbi:hypothetical protein ACS0TY_035607 [Phlomoides rotata]
MDHPHGHRHTHHNGSDRRDDERDFPHAPPNYGVNEPPPPQVYHTSHSGPPPDIYHAPPPPNIHGYAPPPPDFHSYAPPPPNPHHHPHTPQFPPTVDHYPQPPQFPPTVDHRPHTPEFPPTRPHNPQFPASADHRKEAEWAKKPSVRMYSKAERDYSLTIRNGKVILARSNPADPMQHWVKDEKFSSRVKDEEGYPSFALVNKSTGQAMKHAVGATQPVQLIPYNPDILDESILWTESKDLGDGYRTIRMVNNIRLNVDAFNGDKNHGGVHDGTAVVLWEWKKGDNQRWKIVPH